MKKFTLFLSFCFIVGEVNVYAQHPSTDQNWNTVFHDNFTTLNTYLWRIINNESHGNGTYEEPQIYISENAYIVDGKLVLKTESSNPNEILTCQLGNNCHYINNGGHKYTSAEIWSKTTYKYGYFEIYAKIPSGQGFWPAFWLYNQTPDSQTTDCWYNEIDIFEGNGCLTDSVTCNVHWNFNCPIGNTNDISIKIPTANYSQTYHWYGLEWNENEIKWYIDRQKVRSIKNNMDGIGIQNPMYVIINSALFPQDWGCGTNPYNIVLPNYMYIDEANIYKLICDKNTIINEIFDYNSYYYAVKKSITLSGSSSLSIGQNISLKATDFIELNQGFEAPIGSQLFLETTPCE